MLLMGCMKGLPCQMRNLFYATTHVKHWGRRVTLFAIGAISAAMNVVLANVVFAGEGKFKIPRAFMERSTWRAATVTVVNAGCHVGLAFHYGSKTSTKSVPQ